MTEAEKLQVRLSAIEHRTRETLILFGKIDDALADLDVESEQLKQKALQLIISHLQGKE